MREEKVNQMLTDKVQLEAYINRGQSEIHWKGEHGKQKHFELLDKIAGFGYGNVIAKEINRIRELYDKERLHSTAPFFVCILSDFRIPKLAFYRI